MRTREKIEDAINEDIWSNSDFDLKHLRATRMVIELLLDIRDLLNK